MIASFFNCELYDTSSLPNLFNMQVVSVFKYCILEFISKVYLSINLLNVLIKYYYVLFLNVICHKKLINENINNIMLKHHIIYIFIYLLVYIVFQLIDLL